MKVSLSCFQCNTSKAKSFPEYPFELRDDNTYQIKCDHGHESIILFESHKFELLYEMGIYAMIDGYFREAVSNFAASIERFHEFSIEVFIQSLFGENNKKFNSCIQDRTAQYDIAWKNISNQSERQLGAYIMLYLSVFHSAPELIKKKHIEFRNKVIHKGYFPTEKETLNYAMDMFSYLQAKIIELKENIADYVEYVYERKLREYITYEDVKGKYIVSWSELMTFRSLRPIEEINNLDFNKVIKDRKEGYKPFKK